MLDATENTEGRFLDRWSARAKAALVATAATLAVTLAACDSGELNQPSDSPQIEAQTPEQPPTEAPQTSETLTPELPAASAALEQELVGFDFFPLSEVDIDTSDLKSLDHIPLFGKLDQPGIFLAAAEGGGTVEAFGYASDLFRDNPPNSVIYCDFGPDSTLTNEQRVRVALIALPRVREVYRAQHLPEDRELFDVKIVVDDREASIRCFTVRQEGED